MVEPPTNKILTLLRWDESQPILTPTPTATLFFFSSLSNPHGTFSSPRPLPFPATKPMPTADLASKPPPPTPIVDRYKALLKQRGDDLRVSPDNDVSPPSTEEIVQLYELLLSLLVFNSKLIITDLTIIAGEQRDHGKGIGDAMCARILEVCLPLRN